MSVRVTDNTAQLKARNQRSTQVFLRMLIEEVDNNAAPITPRDTGMLRNSTMKRVLGNRGTIAWNKIYARPQEAGVVGKTHAPVRKYTSSGTGAHYAERAVMKTLASASSILRRAGVTL